MVTICSYTTRFGLLAKAHNLSFIGNLILPLLFVLINSCQTPTMHLFMLVFRLDVGDGREIMVEKCPRNVLHYQCIKYLGPVRLINHHYHHFMLEKTSLIS